MKIGSREKPKNIIKVPHISMKIKHDLLKCVDTMKDIQSKKFVTTHLNQETGETSYK